MWSDARDEAVSSGIQVALAIDGRRTSALQFGFGQRNMFQKFTLTLMLAIFLFILNNNELSYELI